MTKFNPRKLAVTYRGVDPYNLILPRRYTLTHSDKTAQLFLNIGHTFAYDEIGPDADEVFIEWRSTGMNKYSLCGFIRIDDPAFLCFQSSFTRYLIFNKELPLAFRSLRYGDRCLFQNHLFLDYAPIWIYFYSSFVELSGPKYCGNPGQYKIVTRNYS